MIELYYVFSKVFFQKNFLKAISKVDVNFYELDVKFNMQSLIKMVFNNFMKNYFSIDGKVKFDKIDS